jgi:hypothetical protein
MTEVDPIPFTVLDSLSVFPLVTLDDPEEDPSK